MADKKTIDALLSADHIESVAKKIDAISDRAAMTIGFIAMLDARSAKSQLHAIILECEGIKKELEAVQ